MIKISTLRGYLSSFVDKKIGKGRVFRSKYDSSEIEDFIAFVESEQAKDKKGGVVPREKILEKKRLREIQEREAENRQPDPESDMDNL